MELYIRNTHLRMIVQLTDGCGWHHLEDELPEIVVGFPLQVQPQIAKIIAYSAESDIRGAEWLVFLIFTKRRIDSKNSTISVSSFFRL